MSSRIFERVFRFRPNQNQPTWLILNCIICSVCTYGFRCLQELQLIQNHALDSWRDWRRKKQRAEMGNQIDSCIHLIQSACNITFYDWYTLGYLCLMNCSSKSVVLISCYRTQPMDYKLSGKLPVEWTGQKYLYLVCWFLSGKRVTILGKVLANSSANDRTHNYTLTHSLNI